MIYFDTVANLMHVIWNGLAPSPIRAPFISSNESSRVQLTQGSSQKEIIFGKKLNWRTGVILQNKISPDWRDISKPIVTDKKKIADLYLRLFQTEMTMLKSTLLTQILKCSA